MSPAEIARTIQTHLAKTDPENAPKRSQLDKDRPGYDQLTLAERHYYWPRSMYITPQDVLEMRSHEPSSGHAEGNNSFTGSFLRRTGGHAR